MPTKLKLLNRYVKTGCRKRGAKTKISFPPPRKVVEEKREKATPSSLRERWVIFEWLHQGRRSRETWSAPRIGTDTWKTSTGKQKRKGTGKLSQS